MKYKSRGEFRLKSQAAYEAAKRLHILESACSHMCVLRRNPFSREEVRRIARKHTAVSDFYKRDNSAYCAAQRFGILKEVCAGMQRQRQPPGYWTDKLLAQVARRFKSRNEFYHGNLAAYKAAHKRGLLDAICTHMMRAFSTG